MDNGEPQTGNGNRRRARTGSEPSAGGPRGSIARGLAVLAAGAGLFGAGKGLRLPLARVLDTGHTASVPVCEAPVELASGPDPWVITLACAGDDALCGCAAVAPGDRVVREGGKACHVVPGGMRATWRLLTGLPLPLNRASAAELALLDGIGPKLSAAIVAHRQRHGPFPSVDALLAVKGIGPVKLGALGARLAVGGSSRPVLGGRPWPSARSALDSRRQGVIEPGCEPRVDRPYR